MTIIDAHLHFDDESYSSLQSAALNLNLELEEAGIEKALVLHLIAQKWGCKEVAREIAKYDRIESFVNIDPFSIDSKDQLEKALELGFCGLKLHPRLQEFSVKDDAVVELVRCAGELGVPTLIDAFPDGTALMSGFSPLDYAYTAKKCPDSNIIWAHMGGHYVIDMMMLAKRLSNVYFDFSFSLLYYQGSSVPRDIAYAMKSMKYERIFYGSDYPDRSVADTLIQSRKALEKMQVPMPDMDRIFYSNFKEFMQW